MHVKKKQEKWLKSWTYVKDIFWFMFYHICTVHCQNPNFVRNREAIASLSGRYFRNILKVELVLQGIEIGLLQLVATFPVSPFFQTFFHKTISSIFHIMSLVIAFFLPVSSCGSCCIFILGSVVVQTHAWFDSVHLRRTHASVHMLSDMQV